ncbi:unnamed protein product, partial [Linum tenue]
AIRVVRTAVSLPLEKKQSGGDDNFPPLATLGGASKRISGSDGPFEVGRALCDQPSELVLGWRWVEEGLSPGLVVWKKNLGLGLSQTEQLSGLKRSPLIKSFMYDCGPKFEEVEPKLDFVMKKSYVVEVIMLVDELYVGAKKKTPMRFNIDLGSSYLLQ